MPCFMEEWWSSYKGHGHRPRYTSHRFVVWLTRLIPGEVLLAALACGIPLQRKALNVLGMLEGRGEPLVLAAHQGPLGLRGSGRRSGGPAEESIASNPFPDSGGGIFWELR